MITAERFAEYIRELLQIYNEEQEDKTLWELWLHKVHDKSYNNFKASIGISKNAAPTHKETAEVVQQSKNLLNGFRIAGVGGNGVIQAAGDSSD